MYRRKCKNSDLEGSEDGVGVFGSYQKWRSNVLRRSTVKLCVKRQQLVAKENENATGTKRIAFFFNSFFSPGHFLTKSIFPHSH